MAILILAAALVGVTLAQNRTINPDVRIVGCPEFGCPNTTLQVSRNWDTAECRVGFDRVAAVGIAENVIEIPGTDTKLSLTMARGFYGGESRPRQVDNDVHQMYGFDYHYFISKPPSFDLKDPDPSITAGCLLFAHHFFHTFSYDELHGNSSTACPFPETCYEPLLSPIQSYQAQKNSSRINNTENICEDLGIHVETQWPKQENITRCLTDRAESLTGWSHAVNLTSLYFLGSAAPDTIEEVEKKKSYAPSPCRPTLPKGNDMAKLGDDRFIIGNKWGAKILESPKQEGLDGMIPAISVIFYEDGTKSMRVICMRIVGNPPYYQGSAAGLRPETGTLVAILFAVFAVFHLM